MPTINPTTELETKLVTVIGRADTVSHEDDTYKITVNLTAQPLVFEIIKDTTRENKYLRTFKATRGANSIFIIMTPALQTAFFNKWQELKNIDTGSLEATLSTLLDNYINA